MEENHSVKKIIFYSFILILVSAGFIFLLMRTSSKNTKAENFENLTPTIVKKIKGNFSLKTSDNLLQKKVGQSFTINVVADSLGVDVVGYDILISKNSFDLVSVNSQIPEFSIYPNDKVDSLVVTGIKRNGLAISSVWQDKIILEIVLKAKTAGDYSIKILPSLGKRFTKMTDKNTKVYYPEVGELNMEIK